jgi:co-chaperonin GroES (HSP10)
MSNIILPPGMVLPATIQPKEQPKATDSPEEKATQLPEPTGYKVLCIVPDVSDTFENSALIKADAFRKTEEHATTVLFVLKVGPDAYGDKAKFPSGAWCKPGDFVLVRTYSGTRMKIYGKEFRVINDDQVECVIDDPRGITRA